MDKGKYYWFFSENETFFGPFDTYQSAVEDFANTINSYKNEDIDDDTLGYIVKMEGIYRVSINVSMSEVG